MPEAEPAKRGFGRGITTWLLWGFVVLFMWAWGATISAGLDAMFGTGWWGIIAPITCAAVGGFGLWPPRGRE